MIRRIFATLVITAALTTGFSAAAADHRNCLNPAQIRVELAPWKQMSNFFFWEAIDNLPSFRRCGLALGPNDLRFVTTFDELVGVVEWGLNKAKVCRPCAYEGWSFYDNH